MPSCCTPIAPGQAIQIGDIWHNPVSRDNQWLVVAIVPNPNRDDEGIVSIRLTPRDAIFDGFNGGKWPRSVHTAAHITHGERREQATLR